MKKHIAESLPERKHAPATAAAPAAKGGEKPNEERGSKGGKSPEERVRQAVYDIRYRARREDIPLQQAYTHYMQNSSMSGQEKTLVKQKLFGKGGMKAEDFNMVDAASTSVANALFKVFVEGVNTEEPIRLTYMEKLERPEHKVYLVRVEDKNGRGYTRRADREKIAQLRANPNIQRVEIVSTDPHKKTAYGEPYEGERTKGELTTKAKRGEKLDPVGQEDNDIDNDGDSDKTDKYLLNRRKVRGAAIAKKEGMKEEFLVDANTEALNPDANEPEIDVMKGKNTVKINPEVPGSGKNTRTFQYAHYEAEGEVIAETDGYSKFLGMLQEKKMTKASKKKEKKLKAKYDPSDMKASMIQQYGPEKGKEVYFATIRKQAMKEEDEKPKMDSGKECDDDRRSKATTKSLIASKFQSMGVKNPIVMVAGYEPDGNVISEREYGDDDDETTPQRRREIEAHNAALRRNQPPETYEQRVRRKSAEQRARGAHRRPRPGTYG